MKLDRRYFCVWDDFPCSYVNGDGSPVIIYAGRMEYTWPVIDPEIGDPQEQAQQLVQQMNDIWGKNTHRLEVVNNG